MYTKLTKYPYNKILANSSNTPPEDGAYISYKPNLEQINSTNYDTNFVNVYTNRSPNFTNGVDISPLRLISRMQ